MDATPFLPPASASLVADLEVAAAGLAKTPD
jgi:hypothetical protein